MTTDPAVLCFAIQKNSEEEIGCVFDDNRNLILTVLKPEDQWSCKRSPDMLA